MQHETKALGTGCANPELESCPWLPQLFAHSEVIQQPATFVSVLPGALYISA